MINIGHGLRGNWKFPYLASALAVGARMQKEFREGRVVFWTEQKELVMKEIREGGVQIDESIADKMSSYANTTRGFTPEITIDPSMQKKLTECHGKIQAHRQAVAEYEGWIAVLEGNPNASVEVTADDWLYFFGKV